MASRITISGLAGGPIEVESAEKAFELLQSHDYFVAIGEFIFRFSQLEFLIKRVLANYLKLRDDQLDVIVGPYDFAMLCTVAEKTIKLDFDEEIHPMLKKFFKSCRELNDIRNVVAHGAWSTSGARHASRSSLEAKIHFEKPENLRQASLEAQRLIKEFPQFGAVANS